MTRIIVAGGGGFGSEVLCYARDQHGPGVVCAVIDDNASVGARLGADTPYVGTIKDFSPSPDDRVIIAIGEPTTRARVATVLAARGAVFGTVVHPMAYVAPSAHLGAGCIVAPFAFVGPSARLGDHAVLNTYASLGHDSAAGDYTVLSPYAVINGGCRLGRRTFLGTHATVVVGVTVGNDCKVAAGSVAYRAVPDGSLVSGNPAKSRVMFPVLD